MAEVEEPQFTTLSQRIAALNQQQVGKGPGQYQTAGKRPPPPPPPSNARPPLPVRGRTTNNPPVPTEQTACQPTAAKSNGILPPPPVDRDNPRPSITGNVRSSPDVLTRNPPPPLPTRKASQPSPALPPRRASTQMARRGSNSSTLSQTSTVSGMSLGQTTSWTSLSSKDGPRGMAPTLDQARLPPLPPSRRELEERERERQQEMERLREIEKEKENEREKERQKERLREREIEKEREMERQKQREIDKEREKERQRAESAALLIVPKVPSRPSRQDVEVQVETPNRTLPPPAATKSALTMGFGALKTKSKAPSPAPTAASKYSRPNTVPRPAPARTAPKYVRPTGPAVHELTARTFDAIVMGGKPALVDFYAPYCKYCTELDPIWKKLGQEFSFASDKLVIAKVDVDAHKSFLGRFGIEGYPTIMFFDGHNEKPELYRMMRELDSLTEFLTEKTGISPSDAPPEMDSEDPPPIPLSSKPSAAQVKAVQNRPAPTAPPASGCLLCRDFSGPDRVGAQHPRHSIPRTSDAPGYLAGVLCGQFTSDTDKARAIFTWLHHNIAYDTVAFFGKTVKHVEPSDTISSGLAVCGGYAGVFVAIAIKAGLECIMVTGHGKGYGHTVIQDGDPVPPRKVEGHAWNAVRIDGGEWKLIDSCWGAGNVGSVGSETYNKAFNPSMFTMSNDEFGLKHFPADDGYFFRSDGSIPTWEEYMIGPVGGEPLQLFNSIDDQGRSGPSFQPATKFISVNSSEIIRFQFSKVCEHWDHEKNGQGKPYCILLKINGVDGRKEDYVAFENNDFWWWADVPARDLGAPGQKVGCMAVTTFGGKDGRGVTRREYMNKRGKVSMSFAGIATWELR